MEAIASNNEKICTGMGVLIRNRTYQNWYYDIFSRYEKNKEYPYICLTDCYIYCIPYENNEDLLGTDRDPNRKFKFGDKVKSSIRDENTGEVIQIKGILVGINSYNTERTYEVATNGYDENKPSKIYQCSKIEYIGN